MPRIVHSLIQQQVVLKRARSASADLPHSSDHDGRVSTGKADRVAEAAIQEVRARRKRRLKGSAESLRARASFEGGNRIARGARQKQVRQGFCERGTKQPIKTHGTRIQCAVGSAASDHLSARVVVADHQREQQPRDHDIPQPEQRVPTQHRKERQRLRARKALFWRSTSTRTLPMSLLERPRGRP